MSGDTQAIAAVTLASGDATLRLLSLGCITQDWQVTWRGEVRRLVLGYASADDYLTSPVYLGVIAGPVANRISGARFSLDGQTYALDPNEGANLLHGGAGGFGRAHWKLEQVGDASAVFHLERGHLEDGFPGHRQFEVSVTLSERGLVYDMTCTTDRPTPVNLAQHNYYTGGMAGPLWDMRVRVAADHYTPVGPDKVPTGEIASLTGRDFDFRDGRCLADADPDARGIDLNYILTKDAPAAQLSTPEGLGLSFHTDQPGMQVFTAPGLARRGTPPEGQAHAPFHGICLEPQGFPDALNHAAFPSIVATRERPYRQVLKVLVEDEAEL